MRIVVVSDLPQFVTGGAEMQAARLIEAWLNSGHEVTCLGRRMDSGTVAVGHHRIAVHRIHATSLIGRWGRAASYTLSLAWLLLRHRRWADVIYCRFLGDAAVTAALLKQLHLIRAPLIATPANTRGHGDISYLRSVPFSSWLIRLLDRCCDGINLIADGLIDELKEAGFSGHNFSCIPNGIPVTELKQRSAQSSPLFLAVGRLVPQKGYDVLLRAMAHIGEKLDSAEVRVIGDGPEGRRLVALARELGVEDRVRWLGELPQAAVIGELEQARLFLLPSRYEGLSNAGLEAMERGLPLILTRCGGLDRYVDNQTGWVVPPGDVMALADALSQAVAADSMVLSCMGARARAVVERDFDMAVVADRYIRLFERCSERPIV